MLQNYYKILMTCVAVMLSTYSTSHWCVPRREKMKSTQLYDTNMDRIPPVLWEHSMRLQLMCDGMIYELYNRNQIL